MMYPFNHPVNKIYQIERIIDHSVNHKRATARNKKRPFSELKGRKEKKKKEKNNQKLRVRGKRNSSRNKEINQAAIVLGKAQAHRWGKVRTARAA
jgi:hypothetical protein